jgi:FKBP-type peptidyl-prolyl cis-trans isomerase (trigger factor)
LAHLESVDRPAAPGDFVTARLVGTRGGAIVYEDEDLTLQLDEAGARSAHVPPDLVTALVGHTAGDPPFSFQARYPDDWPQPELQGADVSFEAELIQVADYSLPDPDDALAEQAGAESVDELRTRIRASLVERTQADARDEQLEAALTKLVELADITYPPGLLETETADLVADLRTRIERQGFQWERWLELQRRDEDAVWADLEKDARERLERRLALSAFVRAEGIAVGDDEVTHLVGVLRESARADRRRLPKDSELRHQMFHRLLAERSLNRLLEIATSPAASPPPVLTLGDQHD